MENVQIFIDLLQVAALRAGILAWHQGECLNQHELLFFYGQVQGLRTKHGEQPKQIYGKSQDKKQGSLQTISSVWKK